MGRFGEHMKESDLARIDLEKKCLDFEREPYESDYQDRICEREERRKESKDDRRQRREKRDDERRERRDEL